MHLLLVALSAPPKNSAEAMQVGRFLAALDPAVRVTLVTTPVVPGWQWEDPSLRIDRPGLRVITLDLPFHRLTQRVLSNHRLAALHVPDADFWIPWLANRVLRQLDGAPDAIYSRSTPFSGALLAQRLKRLLRRPWLMHLSDPWADSPYRPLPTRRAAIDSRLEAACFREADLITLTTEGQATHYRARYPERAQAIRVTPNMMPIPEAKRGGCLAPNAPSVLKLTPPGCLNLVHTGALYGNRNPDALLQALDVLRKHIPALSARIRLHFLGNMYPHVAARIDASPECERYGPVPFALTKSAQSEADLLVAVEPNGSDPMFRHFLLSKVVDYLASDKPIVALTTPDSITTTYCRKGFGWAFSPDDAAGLAEFFQWLLARDVPLRGFSRPPPPPELEPERVTRSIQAHLDRLYLPFKDPKPSDAG